MSNRVRGYSLISVLLVALASSAASAKDPQPRGGPQELDLQRQIDVAIARGHTSITVPKGEYRLRRGLHIRGAHGLVIDGQGSTFIFTYLKDGAVRDDASVAVEDSKNVVLRNFSIDLDPLPNTQGRVIAKAADGSWYDLKIDVGYPKESNLFQRDLNGELTLHVFDPVTRILKRDSSFASPTSWDVLSPDHPDVVRIRTPGADPAWDNVQVGDLLATAAWRAVGIRLQNCSGTVLDGITIHSAYGAAVAEQGGEGGADARIFVTPGPKPAGATEDRLLGVIRDGWHSGGVRTGANIHDSLFERMGDDAVNFYAPMLVVTAIDRAKKTLSLRAPFDQFDGKPGDRVEVYRGANWKPFLKVHVTGTSLQRGHSVQLESVEGIRPGDVVVCPDRASAGGVVRNTTIRNIDGIGVFAKGPGIVIDHNTIESTAHAGIAIAPTFGPEYFEGPWPSGIRITGNTLTRNGLTKLFRSDYWPMFGSISITLETPDYAATLGTREIKDISIRGNTITESSGAALLIANASGVSVEGNFISGTNLLPPLKSGVMWGATPEAAIFIHDSDHVKLSENTVKQLGPYAKRALQIDSSADLSTIDPQSIEVSDADYVSTKPSLTSVVRPPFSLEYDAKTGGIQRITNTADSTGMNWVLRSDGSQYPWQTKEQAWGLGFAKVQIGSDNKSVRWSEVVRSSRTTSQTVFSYDASPLQIDVTRTLTERGIVQEDYKVRNQSGVPVRVTGLGIYAPFNDNYPDAETSTASRCNAHIWAGGHSSYVNAMRMGASAPHLGLVLTKGSLRGYEVANRGLDKGSSNFRGTIILDVADFDLEPNAAYEIGWTLFWHNGWDDFFRQASQVGGFVKASAASYVIERGQELNVKFEAGEPLLNAQCFVNDQPLACKGTDQKLSARYLPVGTGEQAFSLHYGNGRSTFVRTMVLEKKADLVASRVHFIATRQQMLDKTDPRFGAYLVYDNEVDRVYKNEYARQNDDKVNTNEGAERLGMGVLLAMYLQSHEDKAYRQSVDKYYEFVRRGLQTEDYKVYSTADHDEKSLGEDYPWVARRGYNYPLVAHFYLEMYNLTGDVGYLRDYYGTLKAFYGEFKHKFYAIGIPVKEGLDALAKAGMTTERNSLLEDFREMADVFIANGIRYPKHEVNYEQSIVAPSVIFLCEMFLATKELRYLKAAELQLPLLDAFAGQQPDYRLNDIAIRHWDGFWFGKRQFWGDVFPHYWSALSAVAYWRYFQATGKQRFMDRANHIIDSNFTSFFPDGRATCAYIYPSAVNGVPAHFPDPFANDQDWALVFALQINRDRVVSRFHGSTARREQSCSEKKTPKSMGRTGKCETYLR